MLNFICDLWCWRVYLRSILNFTGQVVLGFPSSDLYPKNVISSELFEESGVTAITLPKTRRQGMLTMTMNRQCHCLSSSFFFFFTQGR